MKNPFNVLHHYIRKNDSEMTNECIPASRENLRAQKPSRIVKGRRPTPKKPPTPIKTVCTKTVCANSFCLFSASFLGKRGTVCTQRVPKLFAQTVLLFGCFFLGGGVGLPFMKLSENNYAIISRQRVIFWFERSGFKTQLSWDFPASLLAVACLHVCGLRRVL